MPFKEVWLGDDYNCTVEVLNFAFIDAPDPVVALNDADFTWLVLVNGNDSPAVASISVDQGDGEPVVAAALSGGPVNEWTAQLNYPLAGTFTAVLTITDNNGDLWTHSETIVVV